MYKMKQKVVVALSAVFISVSLLPMTANAYTDREINMFLGTMTEQDVATYAAEADALSQIFNGISVSDVTSAGTGTNEQSNTVSAAASNTIFDAVYYADKYPDLKAAYGYDSSLLLNHFNTVGMAEGRQASANFNAMVYKNNNPDLQNAFQDNWVEYYSHFVNGGYSENRVSH